MTLCVCGCGGEAKPNRRFITGHNRRGLRGNNRVAAPIAERFWAKVSKGDGCWLWTGSISKGYGTIGAVGGYHGQTWKAHRVSWELHHGPVPEGLFVCHRCDVRHCVRPDHLFLGSQTENNRDMWRKGRGKIDPKLPFGERHGQAKLTADAVREIRLRRAAGETLRSIARKHGVDYSTVQAVLERRTWSHVT